MNWTRIDDLDDNGNIRVRYTLHGFDFEIRATKFGVQLTGTTPYYTDWTSVQERLSWCQYISQRLKETGEPISQYRLERGQL